MTQLIIGFIIGLFGIYLQDGSYPLIGVLISVIGFSIMLRGRRQLDRIGFAQSAESKRFYTTLGLGVIMLVIGISFAVQHSYFYGIILSIVGLVIAFKGKSALNKLS